MNGKRGLATVIVAVAALAALVVGVRWWLFARTHVETDDAYVRADVAAVTPRVSGTIQEILVDANWQVEKDQVLVRLDPAEQKLKLEKAEATLARVHEEVHQLRAALRAAESGLDLARADLEQAKIDFGRASQLTERGVAPTDRLDRARTVMRMAQARVVTATHDAERARAALGPALDGPDESAPSVREAAAARDEAVLMLEYTTIRAPIAGVVGRRGVEVGERVQPGEPLMAIVPVADAYVEANFKETQLTAVRVGQPATIVADLYPGVVLHGRVDGLSPATGSAFALLPPENATGNWVKVTQRVPVRLALEEAVDMPALATGVSAEVKVDTGAGNSVWDLFPAFAGTK